MLIHSSFIYKHVFSRPVFGKQKQFCTSNQLKKLKTTYRFEKLNKRQFGGTCIKMTECDTVANIDVSLPHRIGFVGGGQMALALAKGFMAGGLVAPDQVTRYIL